MFVCFSHAAVFALAAEGVVGGSSNSEGYAPCSSVDLLTGGKYFYSKDESKIKIIKITNSIGKQ